jgi:hypothetical protein
MGRRLRHPFQNQSGSGSNSLYATDLNLYDATINYLENGSLEVQYGYEPVLGTCGMAE